MSGEKFANGLYRKGVLEMLHTYGVDTTKESCLDVLVDFLRKFVFNIGKNSVSFSDLLRRSDQTMQDVVNSLRSVDFHTKDLIECIVRLDKSKDKFSYRMNIPNFPLNVRSNMTIDSSGERRKRKKLSNVSDSSSSSSSKDVKQRKTKKGGVLASLIDNKKGDGESNKNEEENEKNEKNEKDDDEEEFMNFNFLPPFPPEYTYKFSYDTSIDRKSEEDWKRMASNEKKEVEKSLTSIHRAELEKYSSNMNYFGKDQWKKMDFAQEEQKKEQEKEQTQENETIINPYFVISSRKQSIFRENLINLQTKTIPDEELMGSISFEQQKVKAKKRKRPILVDEEERQRVKRFKSNNKSGYNQSAHELLTRTKDI